jgi:hypothetical protein
MSLRDFRPVMNACVKCGNKKPGVLEWGDAGGSFMGRCSRDTKDSILSVMLDGEMISEPTKCGATANSEYTVRDAVATWNKANPS